MFKILEIHVNFFYQNVLGNLHSRTSGKLTVIEFHHYILQTEDCYGIVSELLRLYATLSISCLVFMVENQFSRIECAQNSLIK